MLHKKQGNNEAPEEGALFRDKSAAQRKWDEQRGEEFCYVAEWLRKSSRSGLYVYELVYRVDVLGKDDPMLLVKAVDDGKPVVAFVYSPGILTGMSNLAGLFRSGSVKWREDTYPSRKLSKMLGVGEED